LRGGQCGWKTIGSDERCKSAPQFFATRKKAFKKGRKIENGDNSPSLADLASGGDAEDEMPVFLDIAAGNAARVLQRRGDPPAPLGQPAS
jgi:hypothetical protein